MNMFLFLRDRVCLSVHYQIGAQSGQFTMRSEQLSDGPAAAAGQTDGPVFGLCQR